MLIRHAVGLLRLCALLVLVLPALPPPVAAAPPRQDMSSPLMVYHQLTQRPEGSLRIDSPVLSGDGRRAVWAESPLDPKERNRVFVLDLDGGHPEQIDAYRPICGCLTRVDISNDGNTVVSTEGVRIRVLSGVATFGEPREVLRLSNDVISALRISGDGRIIVFVVKRDTTISEPDPRKRGAPIPRGVWAISASGGELLPLAGIREIAAISGEPVTELETASWSRSNFATNALDVSDDGRRIVFAARAESAGDGVFILGEGTPLTQLFGPAEYVTHVAVSGDGQTVAFASTTLDVTDVVVLDGGSLKPLPDYDLPDEARLQLSHDGTKLLIVSRARGTLLVEVATLATRELFPRTHLFFFGARSNLFTGRAAGNRRHGTNGATMNAAGTRVLYVPDPWTVGRIGPDVAKGGNLAVVELGATALGGAPLVRAVHVDPDTIPRDGSKSASVTAEVSWDGALIGVWLEILRDGAFDPTFESDPIMQEGPVPDPGRVQGVFTATLASRDKAAEPGPRQLRVVSESQAADGRRHGTILETDKTLTIGDTATSGQIYRGTASGLTIDTGSATTPGQLVIGSVTAEVILEPVIGGNFKVTGRSLSYEAERVSEFGRQQESFTSAAGDGDLWGAWGLIRFEGQMTTRSEQSGQQTFENWTVDFRLVRDSSGQLVLCPHNSDLGLDEQAANVHCLTTAMVVLRPVEDAPPPSPQAIT